MSRILPIKDLSLLAAYLCRKLKERNSSNSQLPKYKYILLYAYNGTGKPASRSRKQPANTMHSCWSLAYHYCLDRVEWNTKSAPGSLAT